MNQLILSKPIKAGIISDARETSEILAERVDRALNFDRDSLNIHKLSYKNTDSGSIS
jgi:hypothetical protein